MTKNRGRLYRNLVNEVALTLKQIFDEKRYADKAVERVLKSHPQWGSSDRRFVAEAVYDIVRNYRLFATVAGNERNYWFITAVWLVHSGYDLPDWPEFVHVKAPITKALIEELQHKLWFKYSYPDWLWKLLETELGEQRWRREAAAMHQTADVFLRVNTLKTAPRKLMAELNDAKLLTELVEGMASALKLLKRTNVFQNKFFKEGLFEVQDAGSQMISEFVQPQPGELVIDGCAGAGGKTLHLAALMKNKGRILAFDVEDWKLEELKKRARRAGVHMVQTKVIASKDDVKKYHGQADKLLLDVPCSGLGVLKRNPDAKWKLSAEVITRTKELQKQILIDYCEMTKPGGTLIYSTCSLLPSENETQVNRFLDERSDFTMTDEQMLWPSEGFDGFYMAKLKRKT